SGGSPYIRQPNPYGAVRVEKYRSAGELQWQSANQLQALARVLRLPGDALNVLREARERVEAAIAKQDTLNQETKDAEKEKDKEARKNAKDARAKHETKAAEPPQNKASAELRDVKKQLDDMIAKAEKEKNDPLAALKKAAEELNKVIKDQTDTRNETKEVAKD